MDSNDFYSSGSSETLPRIRSRSPSITTKPKSEKVSEKSPVKSTKSKSKKKVSEKVRTNKSVKSTRTSSKSKTPQNIVTPNFEMYPQDLYYLFLKDAGQNPNYINKSLNKQYTEDVMGNHCLISVKPKELKNYVKKNKPYLTCHFVVTPIDHYRYSYYHGIIKKSNIYEYEDYYTYNNSDFFGYIKTDDDDDHDSVGHEVYDELPFGWVYNPDGDREHQLPNTSFAVGYDLITTYYILKKRLSCNVAKKAVIDTLDYVVENASNEKILLYLICHAKIIGVTIPDTPIGWSLPEQAPQMIQHIGQLYPLIKRYLHILDDTIYVDLPKYVLEDGKKYAMDYF